jgi:hypothetical protein
LTELVDEETSESVQLVDGLDEVAEDLTELVDVLIELVGDE